MEANVLSSMGGVAIYGIISICLFFAVFTGTLFWAFRLKGSYLKTMSQLPLESEPESNLNTQSRYE